MPIMDIATLGLEVDARQIREGDRALDSFERTGRRADQTTERLSGTMARLQRAMAAAVAALGLQELIRMADAYSQMAGRMSLVTRNAAELAEVQEKLFQIAQRSRTGLVATSDLYAKLARSTEDLGVSQTKLLGVTETINKAMAIGGASSESAAGALNQLGQAFASGVLRGDEFNSVMEASPRLIEAIGAGMGRTSGEMRAMAEAGKLTSAAIMQALISQGAAVDAEFAKLPTTVGQGMTLIQNALLRTIGVFDQTNQLSAGLASGLASVAANFDKVVAAAVGLGSIAVARWLVGITVETWRAVTATSAQITAERTRAAAVLAAATAQVASTAAAVTATTARLAEARASTLAATGATQLALTTNALIPAQQRAAAAALAHAAALRTQALAGTQAAAVGGMASRVVGLLGGPLGIVTTLLGVAAAAWMYWGNKTEEATEKAAKSVNEETAEVIADLDKQIKKLDERNRLMKFDPVLAKDDSREGQQKKAILAEIDRIAGDKSLNVAARTELLRLQGAQYNELTIKMDAAAKKQAQYDATVNGDKKGEWLAKNTGFMTKAEQLAAAIAKAKEELGKAFDSDVEARIRKSFEAKVDNKIAKATDQAAQSAREYLVTLEDERKAIGATASQQTMLAAARAASTAPAGTAAKIMETAQALTKEREAYEQAEEARLAAIATGKALADAAAGRVKSAEDAVTAMQKEIDTYGMGAEAVTRYTLAKLNARLAGTANADERNEIEKLIAATQKLAGLQEQKAALDALFAEDKAESFGDALRDSFGSAGSALGKLADGLQDYREKEERAEKARAKALLKHGGDERKAAKDISRINSDLAADRIDGFASMAGAAKGFFSENSKGYAAMEAVERGFRAWEMAATLQAMYAKLTATTAVTSAAVAGSGATAAAATAGAAAEIAANTAKGMSAAAAGVANQAGGDPYTAFPRMAAMAALMAALGFAVAGARGSSGQGGKTAAQQQAEQGTGSVLGDAGAKSASIARSLEIVSKNSNIELSHTSGMLDALRAIEASMTGLTNLVVRSPGVTSGSNMGIQTGTLSGAGTGAKVGGALAGAAGGFALGSSISLVGSVFGPIGAALGAVLGSVIGKLWGKTKQDIVDSGISFGGSANALQAGQGFNQYASVDTTKSSWFGLKKKTTNSVQTAGLDDELAQQFGMIFTNLEKALGGAAVSLGMRAEDVAAAFDAITISETKLSLKGLTGEALTDAINAVISKTMDEMASKALPAFDQFRQVGEGYAETVIRVADNYANLDSILRKMGDTFGAVGLESLAARERLISLAGGIDALNDIAGGFAGNYLSEEKQLEITSGYVAEQMAALGLSHITTRDQFRDTALAIDKTTEAGARQWLGMMRLQQVFADMLAGQESMAEKAANAARERAEAEADAAEKIADAAREKAEAEAEAAQASLDAAEKLREAARTVAQSLVSGVGSAFDVLSKVVDREKKAKQAAHDLALKNIDVQINATKTSLSKHKALADALKSTLDKMRVPGQDLARRQAAQAQIRAARSGPLPDLDELRGALDTVGQDSMGLFATFDDYARDFYATAQDISALNDVAVDALNYDERMLLSLEDERGQMVTLHTAEMSRLDQMVETARQQVELLNGTNTALLTLTQAFNNFALAMSAARANPVASVGGGITSAYQTALGRNPEQAALDMAEQQVSSGTKLEAVIDNIYNSNEAKVVALFREVLKRDPLTEGRQFWTQALNNGVSYESVREQVMNSPERQAQASRAAPAESTAAVATEISAMRTEIRSGLMTIARHTNTTAKTVEEMNYREGAAQ